jgi:hypothetical protein
LLAQIIGTQALLRIQRRKMSYRQWPNAILIPEELRRNPALIADRC